MRHSDQPPSHAHSAPVTERSAFPEPRFRSVPRRWPLYKQWLLSSSGTVRSQPLLVSQVTSLCTDSPSALPAPQRRLRRPSPSPRETSTSRLQPRLLDPPSPLSPLTRKSVLPKQTRASDQAPPRPTAPSPTTDAYSSRSRLCHCLPLALSLTARVIKERQRPADATLDTYHLRPVPDPCHLSPGLVANSFHFSGSRMTSPHHHSKHRKCHGPPHHVLSLCLPSGPSVFVE